MLYITITSGQNGNVFDTTPYVTSWASFSCDYLRSLGSRSVFKWRCHLPLAKADAVAAFNLRFCFLRHFHTSTRKKTKSITRMMIMAMIIYSTSCLLSSSATIGLTLPYDKNVCICKDVVLWLIILTTLTHLVPTISLFNPFLYSLTSAAVCWEVLKEKGAWVRNALTISSLCSFSYLLKISENCRPSHVFKGYRNGTLSQNTLTPARPDSYYKVKSKRRRGGSNEI